MVSTHAWERGVETGWCKWIAKEIAPMIQNERIQELQRLAEKSWEEVSGRNFFTGIKEYDETISNLGEFPHLFVLGCVMDRQMRADRVWKIPYEFAIEFLNKEFSFQKFEEYCCSSSAAQEIENFLRTRHRFPNKMAGCFINAVHRIRDQYSGHASNIWNNKPASAELVVRFLEFEGIGQKIANMAAMILVRDFGVCLQEYHFIDIPIDIHVKRTITRSGFALRDDSNEMMIARIRAINPDFPGKLDSLFFFTGRDYCNERNPKCESCNLSKICQWKM